jgi:3-oxoadipate CoA-transferase alpha subunit
MVSGAISQNFEEPQLIDKRIASVQEAVADIQDGATLLVSGFGGAGSPIDLLHAVLDQGAKELTIVSNNAGNGQIGIAALVAAGRVAKIVCSFPRSSQSEVFTEAYRAGRLQLETVPQGTLAERIRAAGAGIPAFYTPTSAGTPLEEGKDVRYFNGVRHVLEHALHGDVALVKAHNGDRWGNLTYHMTQRNFGPIMCTATQKTIVQVKHVVGLGEMEPDTIVTPSIYVDRMVHVPDPLSETDLLKNNIRRTPQ